MKYAFSTLACPAWSVEQVIDAATGLGYDGVEFRLLDGALIDPVADQAKLHQAMARCRARGLAVCALDTSCRFNHAEAEAREREVAALLTWIGVAADLEVPLLRVFGGAPADAEGPAPADEEGTARVADALRQAAPAAARAGVTVALETHDAFSSARRVADVLRRVDSPAVGALWDSHHPYRMGESVAEVIGLLGPYLAHVHVKDARRVVPGEDRWALVLGGEGEVPVREQLQALREHGYQGYVSVEWEKKWHPEIAEPEVALPQHLAWLRGMAG